MKFLNGKTEKELAKKGQWADGGTLKKAGRVGVESQTPLSPQNSVSRWP